MENLVLKGDLQKLSKTLLLYALSLTCEKEQTKNVLLETCLKTLENENKSVCSTDFQGWVLAVMRSLVLNDYHRLAKGEMLPIEEQYRIGLAGQVEQMYEMRQIAEVLDLLPEEDCRLFVHFLQGYKYEEIATLLYMPLDTVKLRMYAIRKSVAEKLKSNK